MGGSFVLPSFDYINFFHYYIYIFPFLSSSSISYDIFAKLKKGLGFRLATNACRGLRWVQILNLWGFIIDLKRSIRELRDSSNVCKGVHGILALFDHHHFLYKSFNMSLNFVYCAFVLCLFRFGCHDNDLSWRLGIFIPLLWGDTLILLGCFLVEALDVWGHHCWCLILHFVYLTFLQMVPIKLFRLIYICGDCHVVWVLRPSNDLPMPAVGANILLWTCEDE